MAPAASPARSIYKLQAAVLSEVRTFSISSLRHVPSIRVTEASGAVREEPWRELQVSGARQALVACCADKRAASGLAWARSNAPPVGPALSCAAPQ